MTMQYAKGVVLAILHIYSYSQQSNASLIRCDFSWLRDWSYSRFSCTTEEDCSM